MKHAGLIKFFDTYAEKKKETTSEPKKEKKKEREPCKDFLINKKSHNKLNYFGFENSGPKNS